MTRHYVFILLNITNKMQCYTIFFIVLPCQLILVPSSEWAGSICASPLDLHRHFIDWSSPYCGSYVSYNPDSYNRCYLC